MKICNIMIWVFSKSIISQTTLFFFNYYIILYEINTHTHTHTLQEFLKFLCFSKRIKKSKKK